MAVLCKAVQHLLPNEHPTHRGRSAMLRRTLLSMGAMLMMSVLSASQAYGSFIIAVSLNGGAKTVVASGADFTPLIGSVNFGGYTSDFSSASSANANLSKLLTSNLNITNVGNSTNDVLNIFVTQTNYSLPTGPFIEMQSSAAGSSPNAANNPVMAGIFQAYFDASNTPFGMSSTNGLQSATANGASYDTGSNFGIFPNPGMYSVTSQLNVVLGLRESTNINTSISLTAMPVPAGLVLVATAAPLIGFGWLRRRRLISA